MTLSSSTNSEVRGKSDTACRRLMCALTLAATLGLGGVPAQAMPAAPAGLVETGAPSFVVLGPEALGLSTAPIDLHLLPDGRILVVSQHELAFGDGIRWEAFQGAGQQPPILAMVAVDRDGGIYTGFAGGFARIDLGDGARWHFTPVAGLPGEVSIQSSTMSTVAMFPDRWYWYGQDNAVVSWRPGQTARVLTKAGLGGIDRIFPLGGNVYIGNETSGEFLRVTANGTVEPVLAADSLVSESVTSATPFGPDLVLLGTVSAGLKLFDGKTFRPFGPPGLLSSGHRITDLCPTGEGLFAAAVDTIGIVFFDREGRTVQVLDRALDHRLARVRRFQYAREGVLWALLDDGVARVEFPSPLSHFEPLLASGLTFALPLRHAGRLWILADGRAMRGIYDATGRLERFEDDTPPGSYLFSLVDVDGQLFATNDKGIYLYEPAGWRLIFAGIVNARIGTARSSPEGLYYVARGEYGVIQRSGQSYTVRKTPAPDLGDSYNVEVDSTGIGWIELGVSRIGRMDPHGGKPTLQILGTSDGFAVGWIELYQFEGIARFHVAGHLYRFDDTQRKFVEDRELLARFPQLADARGRPVTDSYGRFWYTANGAAQVIDRSAAGGNRPVKIAAVGFAPTGYTTEEDGVIWMFERRRLARMDLRLPQPPDSPLRALITSVQFSASSRQLFAPGVALEPLNYADNSLVIHFAAPANPFAAPVTFEVLLEGAGTQWVSTGAVGSATFNRLKEGLYVFRVRPVAGGTTIGAEARLQFTVRPPWFRTTLAWGIYIAATAGLFAFVTWLSSFLQRRENERLEQLVAKRTGELNATNAQLARQIEETTAKSAALSVSEERYRLLNTELEDRVHERTAELAEASGLLEAMLDNSPDLIYFKDRASRFVRFSKAYLPRLGLTEPEMLRGKSDADFYAADHAQPALADEQEIIRTGKPIVGKLEKETYPDGRVTWALTTKMPWRDGTGAIVGTFGISKDVTDLKEVESRLSYERDLLRALLDSSPDQIYFKDLQSRFIKSSNAQAVNFGKSSPDDLVGMTDFDFFTDEHARPAFEDEQEIIRTGRPLIGKVEKETWPDGRETWVITSKMALRNTAGEIIGTIGISKDISLLKQAEAKLEQLHQQLMETSRQAGMAEVATSVLHNVGNVLNSVNVSATLVADQLRLSKAANVAKLAALLDHHKSDLASFLTGDVRGQTIPAYLGTLADSLAAEQNTLIAELDHLRKNVEHINDIVAMQQANARAVGVIETISIPDLLEEALHINADALARYNVTTIRDYQAVPAITTDKHKVLQILINLVRNAKLACVDSGRTDKQITLRTTSDDRSIKIAIIDNGVGIPAENLTRIFNHGFTTRKTGHGFALHSGALTAKELGGSLTAQSEGPGHGATFTLELPCQPDTRAHENSVR